MYENGEGKNISNQMVILNAGFTGDAPYMPCAISQ